MENSFSHTIRLLRESKGYSQEWVARKLNLTQQGYGAMERHPENTSLKRLIDLCKIFGIKLSDLIEEIEAHHQETINAQNKENHKGGKLVLLKKPERELYERFITELKEEIEFLKQNTVLISKHG